MKKLVWVLVGVLTFIFTPSTVVRAEQNQRGLLLVEIQTGSYNSASEEFIEIYNAGDQAINLATYRVEYFSAAATTFATPSRSIALSGILYPNGRYLLASTDYLTEQANLNYSATLAKTGGHLRIVNTEESLAVVHDLVGWGTASMPEDSSVVAPEAGQSLQRKILSDGTYQDLNNNSEDFVTQDTPTPESANPQPATEEPEEPEPITPEDPEPTEPEPTPLPEGESPVALLPLQIIELLPNPAAPQTDDEDEFIEIYNPNGVAVNLEGYRLETGNNYSYHYEFLSLQVPPNGTVVLYAKESNLVLANSGGKARLIDPNGSIVYEVVAYDEAKPGYAWAWNGSGWEWTVSPTPGQANIISQEIISAIVAKSSTPKPKKAAVPKPKSTKQPKVASAKAKASPKKTPKQSSENVATVGSKKVPLNPLILAGIGVVALTYAAYEYRTDIANRIHQLRSFRKNRPGNGA